MHLATAIDFFEIKHFLKRHKQSSANHLDKIYIVRQQNSLIGIAKLIIISDASNTKQYWLRGLYIDENWRNQALASRLLTFINQNLALSGKPTEIFAFPFKHLDRFYLQNGYQHIAIEQLPKQLEERYKIATQQQKNWLCMAKAEYN